MSEPQYPYIPDGKTFFFVSLNDPFMQEAMRAQEECSGDQIYPVGAVLVKDGKVVARGGNGYNKGAAYMHICPRVVLECKSGEGYDLCHHHDAPGHAEQQTIKAAGEMGQETAGADLYMYGHWWACEPCWSAMMAAGIRNVYLLENAHEAFSRDNVYAKTLVPSMKNIYLSCGLTNTPASARDLYDLLKHGASEVGVEMYCPHEHTDPLKATAHSPQEIYELDKKRVQESGAVVAVVTWPSLGVGIELEWAASSKKPIVLLNEKGALVSRAALGLPSIVYHIEYENADAAKRQLKNVLKQL
jgi:deoxycytidylate deaminase